MAAGVVNLDALIKRADLAAPGEAADEITSIPVMGLAPKGLLYPALRKPDFQRETASWTPEQVADLISTFANRDLIPAVILWRAGQYVFVIDGAHRLSALIAWVHDDFGDGDVSRPYFHNHIPPDQMKAATRTRELVNLRVGSFRDHQIAIDYPKAARPDIADRAPRIGWQEIPAQWIRNPDHDKAEQSFFRINQGGTKLDSTERRILSARRSATALSARAILRAGTGHSYWERFADGVQVQIGALGGEIHRLLFEPFLTLPHKSLDVPVAGQGYGPHVLPFLFDLVNLINDVAVADSSRRRAQDVLAEDADGSETIRYLLATRALVRRLCSNDPSSLGLHPALYFYSASGVFQPAALLSFVALVKDYRTRDYTEFVAVRRRFEDFLVAHRSITEAVRKLGSGGRSRPRVVALYRAIIHELAAGLSAEGAFAKLSRMDDFRFIAVADTPDIDVGEDGSVQGRRFNRDTKGAAFLREALPNAPRCATCGGFIHRNGLQTGHVVARRDGGAGNLGNAILQHPFCNSTVAQ